MLRKWCESDLARLEALEKECFKDPWSYEMLESEMNLKGFVGLVLEENGVILGYVGASTILDEGNIDLIAVAPSMRKKGYGKLLLGELLNKLFASGITPKGLVNFADTVLDGYKTYILKGYCANCLTHICDIAVNRGFDVEAYYCPFSPDERIDHLVIPKLNLAFTVSNTYHAFDKGEVVDFDEFASKYILETYKSEREFAVSEIDRLIKRAVSTIADAKQYHDELEKYYIPAMDFTKLDEVIEKTIKEVLEFI